MKRFFTSVFLGTILMFTSTSSKAQALEEGNITLDPYYGFLSVAKALFTPSDSAINTEFRFIGPVGAKFEYMMSDKIGFGVDFNYTQMSWEYDERDSASATVYHYNLTRNIIRAMPRINIHFGGSENFDGYFGIGAGYRNATYKMTTNNPNYKDEEADGLIPFALRFSLGGRYYFTDNVGLFAELGLGGGTMFHVGFAFKF